MFDIPESLLKTFEKILRHVCAITFVLIGRLGRSSGGGRVTHRCRSRQIFGVRRMFARISPNLPGKLLGHFLCFVQ